MMKLQKTISTISLAVAIALSGMAQASSEEFKEVCSSLRGSINNPMYMEWAYRRPIAFQFDSFAGTLLAKYESLCAVNKWSGVKRKAQQKCLALLCSARNFAVNSFTSVSLFIG